LRIPRLVLKTHREINHPGLFSVLIKHCTKPTESTFADAIGNCLAARFPKANRKSGETEPRRIVIDKAGGKYGAWMAQQFGFLTENFFWTWKGQVIDWGTQSREVPEAYIQLTELERVLYLRYYLEAQGPLILKICEFFAGHETASRHSLLQDRWIDDIISDIYREYLQLTDDLAERTRLRQRIEGFRAKPYNLDTRPHKIDPILIPMCDLGLLQVAHADDDLIFSNTHYGGNTSAGILKETLQNIPRMEKLFAEYEYFAVATRALNRSTRMFDRSVHFEKLMKSLVCVYKHAIRHQTLVPISFIIDAASADLLCDSHVLLKPDDLEGFLDGLSKRDPLEVQFQVDYRGKRAYVKVSDALLAKLSSERVARLPSGPGPAGAI